MSTRHHKLYQTLITRLPYALTYDAASLSDAVQRVEERSLISVSIPIHVDNPFGALEFAHDMVRTLNLHLVSLIAWCRDRQIVVTKSRRLTNAFELVAIFSRSADYHLTKDAIFKIKKGFEGKVNTFDEDEFLTCATDHWTVKNDRRDRRFLPATIVLNCGQLADLKPGDTVLDPFGNAGIRDACKSLGWSYKDLGLPNAARNVKKKFAEDAE